VSNIDNALARLESWLESMRAADGYGGPVVHWWRQCLLYTGAGMDWRYEGIILGYLELWKRTGKPRWLAKAQRAGDDLVSAQLASGNFRASCFEMNPACGGTPHEAACDLALIRLAEVIKQAGLYGWETYWQCARRNLQSYFIDKLWDPETNTFRDHIQVSSFVPNKSATLAEALFAASELSGDDVWAQAYALPNIRMVLDHQLIDGELQGAICQNSFGFKKVEKYFPYYIARCIPGLLAAYHWSGDQQFAECARLAAEFLKRTQLPKGGWPAVLYPNRRINSWPQWLAGTGDILSALQAATAVSFDYDPERGIAWLLAGQDENGGIRTAVGFSAQAGGQTAALPDLRDALHVVGWADKAFRYLAGQVNGDQLSGITLPACEIGVTLNGRKMVMIEDYQSLEVLESGSCTYVWRKGEAWAHTTDLAFWLH
jgi:hypothetical protein